MYSAAYVWAKVIRHIEDQLGPLVVSTWFDDAELIELSDDRLVIYSPSDFRRETILRNCRQYIEDALRELFRMDAKLVVWGESELKLYHSKPAGKSLWTYNPHFSFDNYIAGSSNLMPLWAAKHVADHPGDPVYTPLYLYGSPGVGKTHLLYAIANHISQVRPELNVVYIKGEQFTNELIRAIALGNTLDFKKKYREADVLLVDDIQFIAGKESTQEEFFHTFNHLHERQKQIVLTSDRKPADIAILEDRLKGRFGAGVMVEIAPPNDETRELIIRDKAKKLGLVFDEPTVQYISGKLCENVRQIEGGLRKIRAYHDLSGMTLSRDNIARTIEDLQTTEISRTVTADTVVRYVCRYYGIEENQLKSTLRSKNIAEPRQLAMYLCRQMTKMSLKDIGTYFGRDHGTVHHAIKKIDDSLKTNGHRLSGILREIQNSIESGI